MSKHPDEWYEIQTVDGEVEDIREYLSLSRPEAEPTAWYVRYDGVESDSEYTVYGDVTRQEAIDTATKFIKRDGRLPHGIYYKERA